MMTTRAVRGLIGTVLLAAAGGATGQTGVATGTLASNPAQSSFNLSVSVAAIGSDTESVTVQGPIGVEVQLVGGLASRVKLTSFDLAATGPVSLRLANFLSSVNLTARDVHVVMSAAGAGTPGAIVPPTLSGTFSQAQNLVGVTGSVDYSYSVFLLGSGSGTNDLADVPPSFYDLTNIGYAITLPSGAMSLTLPLNIVQVIPAGDSLPVDVTVTVSGTIRASGTLTLPVACVADLDGNGSLDIFDILAFFGLFGAADVRADFTSDGVLNIFDILNFFSEFGAGCS